MSRASIAPAKGLDPRARRWLDGAASPRVAVAPTVHACTTGDPLWLTKVDRLLLAPVQVSHPSLSWESERLSIRTETAMCTAADSRPTASSRRPRGSRPHSKPGLNRPSLCRQSERGFIAGVAS